MKSRALRYLPIGVWAAAVSLSIVYGVIAVRGGTSVGDAASALVGITFSTVGVIVASKRPENRVGWMFLGIGVSLALNGFSFTYADYLRLRGEDSLWHWFAWVGTWSWQPGFFLLFPTLFLVFPDGHVHWSRGRNLWGIALAGAICSIFGTLWNPADLPGRTGYRNPVGVEGLLDVSDVLLILGSILWMLAALLASVRGLQLRFRSAGGTERQQLKWFVSAGLATLAMYVVGSSFYNIGGSIIGGVVALFGVPLLPVATAVAILRYRLYDIDRIVNRTLVYGALTVVLAAAYLFIVVVLQMAVSPLTSDSDLVVAASTLVVAALFRPLRGRTQELIDRAFYRSRYDATETLGSFSARLRDQVDLEMLSKDLVRVVGDVMQPAHASVWLRQGSRR